jgi:monoterpene epsilon-lactone hydrolase
MVSSEMEMMIKQLRVLQATRKKPSIELFRTQTEMMAGIARLPDSVSCEPVNASGIPAEWIVGPDMDTDYVMLYLHGGGFVAGSIKSHRNLASRIAGASKIRGLIIEYRLAPEHPFPAAVEDATAVYRWLLSVQGIKPENVVLAGDSAGGNLVLACLVQLRNTKVSLPAAAVCLSPCTDLTLTSASLSANAEIDPVITPEEVEFYRINYLEDADPRNPLASPLYAELHGLPPLFIQVGTAEILLDDSVRFAKRAKAAEVDVTLDVCPDMIHVFAMLAPVVPESQQAISRIAEFIRNMFK